MVPYVVIGTGSRGNSVLVNDSILIDAGLPYIRIEPYMDKIKLCLLTHIHGDHFKASTVRRMALEKPRMRFGCGKWMVKPLVDAGVAKTQIDILAESKVNAYGICNVIPVLLSHDVPNYGYKLHFENGKVFYATDTGSLDGISAKGYDLYLCESNYQEDELRERMDAKLAEGRYAYEQRTVRYHLSKQQCDDWLYRNMGRNSEYVYLHCHEEDRNEGQNN